MTAPLSETHLTEDALCEILRIPRSRLQSRIKTGTEHPPYVQIGRAYYFPMDLFRDWVSKRPIIWEVKRAG